MVAYLKLRGSQSFLALLVALLVNELQTFSDHTVKIAK